MAAILSKERNGRSHGVRTGRCASNARKKPLTHSAGQRSLPRVKPIDFEQRVISKIAWKLIPFLCVCYMAAFLDRVNVGFAKDQMVADLGLSNAVYGAGAGIFFIGYFLFEVPSNLILERVGA